MFLVAFHDEVVAFEHCCVLFASFPTYSVNYKAFAVWFLH